VEAEIKNWIEPYGNTMFIGLKRLNIDNLISFIFKQAGILPLSLASYFFFLPTFIYLERF
jgi:hypothetical protein